MTIHISVRLAWHDNGWNGKICKDPRKNAYCAGPYSYPGHMISEKRDLSWEQLCRDQHCFNVFSKKKQIPPCCFSINAFGKEEIFVKSDPPDFFNDSTQPKIWKIPPASVGIWPYEEMYKAEVSKSVSGSYDYEKRLENAKKYFSSLEADRSLVFYYSNYSNPFSEHERKKYVIIGVARLKEIKPQLYYEGCSENTIKKYAGGFLWQRILHSNYPEEGFMIPYHLYQSDYEFLKKIVFIPDNPRNFKYASRHIKDDDALDIIEHFIEIVGYLKENGDKSENWDERLNWLNSLIAELWNNRGIFPGLLKVLDFIGFKNVISHTKDRIIKNTDSELEIKEEIFDFLNGKIQDIKGFIIEDTEKEKIRKSWQRKKETQKNLLEETLPRFQLSKAQIKKILSINRNKNNIYSSLKQIQNNPYILCEEYIGDDPDDFISFNKIDHGIFPSPDLHFSNYLDIDKDDPRRLRALCIDYMRKQEQHTFISANEIINKINHRLSYFAEWKSYEFAIEDLIDNENVLEEKLVFREDDDEKLYLYLKILYDYERKIEKEIQSLAERPEIPSRSPITTEEWNEILLDYKSLIHRKDPEKDKELVNERVNVCTRIFNKAISVICGGAGTGKTTLIKAIIKAIKDSEGLGTPIKVLAPTGKASDRIREITGSVAETIHSFLARLGWLNQNYTFKREGVSEDRIRIYIIDESSMVDLALMGTLFKAINWNSVRRLILVGDPNQLPPIGTGKVYSDIITWLKKNYPSNIGVLKTNVRQMLNRIEGKGTGILDLATTFLSDILEEKEKKGIKSDTEKVFNKIIKGGDIEKDLRIIFWDDIDDLQKKLIDQINEDIISVKGRIYTPKNPFELWSEFYNIKNLEKQNLDRFQIISPFRGEFYGVDNINLWIQGHFNEHNLKNFGTVNGFTYCDKVLQYRNRTKSDPIYAYNTKIGKYEKINIFNGEIGIIKPHKNDKSFLWKRLPSLRKIQVIFKRKNNYWVNYNNQSEISGNLELAYAISVHKAQGSEFNHVFFILPNSRSSLLTRELLYTGITRATEHLTILVERDISPFLTLRRPEFSQLNMINSSLFQFKPVPEEFLRMNDWYEEGRIQKTLTGIMVRSKSEVIIANMLHEREIPFRYEQPLYASDGSFHLPDFTIFWKGEDWYWEHLGMLEVEEYKNHWEYKKRWYEKYGYSGRLITSIDKKGAIDSLEIQDIIDSHFI